MRNEADEMSSKEIASQSNGWAMAAKPDLGSKQGQNATFQWLKTDMRKIRKTLVQCQEEQPTSSNCKAMCIKCKEILSHSSCFE